MNALLHTFGSQFLATFKPMRTTSWTGDWLYIVES